MKRRERMHKESKKEEEKNTPFLLGLAGRRAKGGRHSYDMDSE